MQLEKGEKSGMKILMLNGSPRANGNTAAVYVNGQKAPAVDFDNRRVDISALLQPGENKLLVEVSSTLNNRLKARGYYDPIKALQGGDENGCIISEVQDYGMTGMVRMVPYVLKEIG